jgi:hypothetical protein
MSLVVDTREFSAAVKEYMKHTKRDLAEVINQKYFSITTAAAKMTHKAAAAQIRAELEEIVTATNGTSAPRAALLVNRNRYPGLRGAEMEQAIERLKKNRASHIAFVRAGWLPAVASAARAIGKPPSGNAVRWENATAVNGTGKLGGGTAAKESINPTAEFWNAAGDISPKATKPGGAQDFAAAGLQSAISQEIGRMAAHVAQKLQGTANKFKPH